MTTPTIDERSNQWITIWTQGQTGTSMTHFAPADGVSPSIVIGSGASSGIRELPSLDRLAIEESEPAYFSASEPLAANMAFHRGRHDFWHPKSFNELAAEQRVAPVTEWDQLTRNWPDGADFEEFFAAVRSARQEE
jgi:hypothetical protein